MYDTHVKCICSLQQLRMDVYEFAIIIFIIEVSTHHRWFLPQLLPTGQGARAIEEREQREALLAAPALLDHVRVALLREYLQSSVYITYVHKRINEFNYCM